MEAGIQILDFGMLWGSVENKADYTPRQMFGQPPPVSFPLVMLPSSSQGNYPCVEY